jgi:uncharacterized protein YkwD
MTDLFNQQRAARGLPALRSDGALQAAAAGYSHVQFNHDPYALNHNLDGSARDRANRQGYYGWIGEVLVTGAQSAPELVNLLMNSPPHAQIILGDFADVGVACHEGPYVINGTTYQIATCVGMFGKRG